MAEEGVSVSSFVETPLKLFPNPANNTVTLCTDATKIDKAVILDSLGNKVKSMRINANTQTIDISNLSAGNYILVLYHKGKSVSRAMFVKA